VFSVICVGIVCLTLLVEFGNGWLEGYFEHKHGWRAVYKKVQDELMLLGLLSFLFFFAEQAMDETDEIWAEHFQLGHYMLFAIGISFTFHCVMLYHAMLPHFSNWAAHEATAHNADAFAELDIADKTEDKDGRLSGYFQVNKIISSKNDRLLKHAEFVVVRSSYIDRYELHDRFDYAEYMHEVSIDYIIEVAEAEVFTWLVTILIGGVVVGIVLGIGNGAPEVLNVNDTTLMCKVATYTYITAGWCLLITYWLVMRGLRTAKKRCLKRLGIGTKEQVVDKLTQILAGDVAWPQGWAEQAVDGIDLNYDTCFTRNIVPILSALMLCTNVYFAFLLCIFGETVAVTFDKWWEYLLLFPAMLIPYFWIILYFSPRILADYTRLHCFDKMDAEVALEQQENLAHSEYMAQQLLTRITEMQPDAKARATIENVFDMIDYNHDGFVDHAEFRRFLQDLNVQTSKRQFANLLRCLDPTGSAKITKELLLYWLFPEEHRKRQNMTSSNIKFTLNKRMSQHTEGDGPVIAVADGVRIGVGVDEYAKVEQDETQ